MSSGGIGVRVIATCLVSSHVLTSSSSFVIVPTTSSSRTSVNRQPHHDGHHDLMGKLSTTISNPVCSKSSLTKLRVVRSSRSNAPPSEPSNISQMSLPQILQLLNSLNVRYPPNAARSELEELLHEYYKHGDSKSVSKSQSTSRTPPRSSSASSESEESNIVDAVVVNDDESMRSERYSSSYEDVRDIEDHMYTQQMNSSQRSRTNDRNYAEGRYESQQREKSKKHRHRRRRRDNYDLYSNYNPISNRSRRNDVIDLDTFDIPDESNRRGDYYDNGAQIFLMGFLEAGKTATQLAVDSIGDAINPFSGEQRWYDEERGQEILDVNILEYSPDYERRTQQRYSSESGRRRGRPRRRKRTRRPERSYRDPNNLRSDVPPRRNRSIERQRPSNFDGTPEQSAPSSAERDVRGKNENTSYTNVDSSAQSVGGTLNTNRRKQRSRQNDTKPIYGLYHDDASNQSTSSNLFNTTEQYSGSQPRSVKNSQPKKIWKKRLRKKFDAALGLETPSSSSEALYDSWKNHVDKVHDGRKVALRDEMNKTKLPTAPSRNNRRSRMRARVGSSQVSTTAKSYLDEPPFWKRDGSTLASVFFDSQRPSYYPSRGGDPRVNRRYNNSLDTLEAILRSPLGRQNTVTSLVLFIARSSLSWFGSLCRWAGVRGTIPQPIVVTAVFAMGVSSRREYRTLSVGLSLLALRMIGEFIHGSLHGNEFWEDNYDEQKHEWTQE